MLKAAGLGRRALFTITLCCYVVCSSVKMSGKTNIRGNRLETEIERSREESNWKKVIELAEHLKARNQPGLGKVMVQEGRG